MTADSKLIDAISSVALLTPTGILSEVLTDDATDDSFDNNCTLFALPSDYFQYIRSVSEVDGTYKNVSKKIVPNILLNHSDANKVLESFYDENKIIRTPIAVLQSDAEHDNMIKIIHDSYTDIRRVDLTYCRKPKEFWIFSSGSIFETQSQIAPSIRLLFPVDGAKI